VPCRRPVDGIRPGLVAPTCRQVVCGLGPRLVALPCSGVGPQLAIAIRRQLIGGLSPGLIAVFGRRPIDGMGSGPGAVFRGRPGDEVGPRRGVTAWRGVVGSREWVVGGRGRTRRPGRPRREERWLQPHGGPAVERPPPLCGPRRLTGSRARIQRTRLDLHRRLVVDRRGWRRQQGGGLVIVPDRTRHHGVLVAGRCGAFSRRASVLIRGSSRVRPGRWQQCPGEANRRAVSRQGRVRVGRRIRMRGILSVQCSRLGRRQPAGSRHPGIPQCRRRVGAMSLTGLALSRGHTERRPVGLRSRGRGPVAASRLARGPVIGYRAGRGPVRPPVRKVGLLVVGHRSPYARNRCRRIAATLPKIRTPSTTTTPMESWPPTPSWSPR
jgi:hypothetical protein